MDRIKLPCWILIMLLPALFLLGCTAEPTEPESIARFATDSEFMVREDGLPALEEEYGFQFDAVYEMVLGLTHQALFNGDVDAALGFSTDGMIDELDLVMLKDDQRFFPVYNPAPVIRAEVLEANPIIEVILNEITAALDTETMANLNYLVDIEELEPSQVAQDWLRQENLITATTTEPVEMEPVIVGSKNYTEQQILGHITIAALENAGIATVDQTNTGDTDIIRNALLEGTIHLYWEYTGTAWLEIFGEEPVADYELYRRVAQRDEENGLIWLDYARFNNSFTILMRRQQAEELGITTISELAKWVNELQEEGG